VGATTYQPAQLQQLWMQAGGNPSAAPMASAIALAESGGNPGNGPNATNDWGLWQIHNGGPALLDPLANAQRAVQMSANGTNWRPWCTAYSDAACGTKGGSFLGAGSPYQRFLSGNPASTPVTTGPADPNAVRPVDSGANPVILHIGIPGVPDITASMGRAIAGGLALVGGGLVLLVSLVILATGASPKKALRTVSPKAAHSGPVAEEPLSAEEAEQKRLYDDELAERRLTKVANREGLVRDAG